MHPSRAGGDTARGRPVGGPGDRAGLRRYADAWRSRPAVDGVARSRGSAPHSRPAPGSRTRRGRTPSRTPPRGTAPCATAWLWLSSPGTPRRDVGAGVRRRRGGTGETDRPAWEDGGARPGGLRSRAHGARRRRDWTRSRPSGLARVGVCGPGARPAIRTQPLARPRSARPPVPSRSSARPIAPATVWAEAGDGRTRRPNRAKAAPARATRRCLLFFDSSVTLSRPASRLWPGRAIRGARVPHREVGSHISKTCWSSHLGPGSNAVPLRAKNHLLTLLITQ